MLVFPAKAPATDVARGFEHRHLNELTGNLTAGLVGLIVGALVVLLMSMRRVGGVVARKSAARARVKKEGRKAA